MNLPNSEEVEDFDEAYDQLLSKLHALRHEVIFKQPEHIVVEKSPDKYDQTEEKIESISDQLKLMIRSMSSRVETDIKSKEQDTSNQIEQISVQEVVDKGSTESKTTKQKSKKFKYSEMYDPVSNTNSGKFMSYSLSNTKNDIEISKDRTVGPRILFSGESTIHLETPRLNFGKTNDIEVDLPSSVTLKQDKIDTDFEFLTPNEAHFIDFDHNSISPVFKGQVTKFEDTIKHREVNFKKVVPHFGLPKDIGSSNIKVKRDKSTEDDRNRILKKLELYRKQQKKMNKQQKIEKQNKIRKKSEKISKRKSRNQSPLRPKKRNNQNEEKRVHSRVEVASRMYPLTMGYLPRLDVYANEQQHKNQYQQCYQQLQQSQLQQQQQQCQYQQIQNHIQHQQKIRNNNQMEQRMPFQELDSSDPSLKFKDRRKVEQYTRFVQNELKFKELKSYLDEKENRIYQNQHNSRFNSQKGQLRDNSRDFRSQRGVSLKKKCHQILLRKQMIILPSTMTKLQSIFFYNQYIINKIRNNEDINQRRAVSLYIPYDKKNATSNKSVERHSQRPVSSSRREKNYNSVSVALNRKKRSDNSRERGKMRNQLIKAYDKVSLSS